MKESNGTQLNNKMEAVVSDFGFARIVQNPEDAAQTNSNIGPIKYEISHGKKIM